MSPDSWYVLKIIFGIISGIFAILAAVFTFCEIAQNEKHEKTKLWFQQKWIIIKKSKMMSLPEKTIRWTLKYYKIFGYKIIKRLANIESYVAVIFCITPFLLGIVVYWIWGLIIGLIALLIGVPIFIIGNKRIIIKERNHHKIFGKIRNIMRIIPKNILYIYLAAVYFTILVLFNYQILQLNILFTALIMLIVQPIYWLAILLFILMSFSIINVDEDTVAKIIIFGIAVALSFTVTFLAMLIGKIANPNAWVPQTLRMLISNVIFDGFTLVITLNILSWAIKKKSLLRIPFAIILDIFIAAILACSSLFFGLVFTERQLSIYNILNILIARSIDGSTYDLGPFFWTMHTTFIPTILYLSFILFAWIGKLILTPVKWFFGVGQEHKSPLKLTAALFAIVTAVFGILYFTADSAQERTEKKIEKNSTTISVRL